MAELGDSDLLDLILRSFRDRQALCGLALAVYRVELTGMLSRMAGSRFTQGDLDIVHGLAAQIAATAGAAELALVQRDALALQSRAVAAQMGGEGAEGPMLQAGLHVIDRILETTRTRKAAQSGEPELN
jgi:hypothetical protein